MAVGAVQQQRWQKCSRKEELLAPCYCRRGRCRHWCLCCALNAGSSSVRPGDHLGALSSAKKTWQEGIVQNGRGLSSLCEAVNLSGTVAVSG